MPKQEWGWECRSCGSRDTESVLSLGSLPLANNLLAHSDDSYELYPLDVVFCSSCRLGQLVDVVPGEKLFSDYVFYSSAMPPVVERARALAKRVMDQYRPSSVLEIASNDGYLLGSYERSGIRVLGIDPARGPANAAALQRIPTIQDFFSLKLAKTLPRFDVIHASNVLAHCPDVNDFVAALLAVLEKDGVCIIEVPYLGDLVQQCQFDTVYHEHVFYFSVESLKQLFNRHGLMIESIETMPYVLGGSLRIFVRNGGPQKVWSDYGLGEVTAMQSRADGYAEQLRKCLIELNRKGKTVWGFGAAAKATVILNYAGIDDSLIAAIADDTPAKQGKFVPGTGIQVRSTEEWLKAQPDVTCIFTWNYARAIMDRYYPEYTGAFISSRNPKEPWSI